MKILVLEDDVRLAGLLARGLRRDGNALDLATTIEDARWMAGESVYDVLVLDVMLPDGDGFDLCAGLRSSGNWTPVLMLTARDAVADRVRGLDVGADDYLIKPFAFEELLARVRALLRRPQKNQGNILALDDLSLDTVTFEVKRAGRGIDLSQKEFALLEYLLRNQNRVLSKDNLISHVWDYDADVLPNTVEVYIGYLRNKIDRPFGGPMLLHTARGFGYKLGIESDHK